MVDMAVRRMERFQSKGERMSSLGTGEDVEAEDGAALLSVLLSSLNDDEQSMCRCGRTREDVSLLRFSMGKVEETWIR